MAKYVLALDQATTSSRAIVFDHAGSIVSVAQQEFPQIYPSPGLVEHDPEAIWSSQLAVAREALQKAGASDSDVAALGITNQRETAIVWDKTTGKPVFNAIVWQSRLTVPICDALKAKGFDKEIRERTGLVTDAYFSGTKVKWILDNVPGVREKAASGDVLFGNVDTFLMWRLSRGRVHATDPSNASRTLMYNIYQGDWDDVILNELGVPRAMLPTVMPSSGVFVFFSRRRRHTRFDCDWSSDVCSSDLGAEPRQINGVPLSRTSSAKRAALRSPGPPLSTPTGYPYTAPQPASRSVPDRGWNSSKDRKSVV